MKLRRDLLVGRIPVILRIILVGACLGAMALGLAAPDDWGYGGWLPKFRH